MSDKSLEYHSFLDEMVGALHTLSEDELALLAAACSTAESRILAAMASNYSQDGVKKIVDIGSGAA
ncbi:MAG TPA: hypothetical protein VLC51_07260 [Nitrospira sp.]|nr:hypothetical protein [Nitrospira sp.]